MLRGKHKRGDKERWTDADHPRAAKRRLSFTRLAFAFLVLVTMVGGGALIVRNQLRDLARPAVTDPWFAPYVDTTAVPQFHFEDPGVNPSRDTVLGFVVASRGDACTPTWGTAYDIAGASTALDLDRRIARVRQRGGDVIVSFGGRANEELALGCQNDDDLRNAYEQVISHYELTTIDFDIEGNALADQAANTRRARVVKQLQDRARLSGNELAVWLTLPVAPSGLTDDGLGVVTSMLAANVDLAGVNLMTMDYGASRASNVDMVDATASALDATFRQIDGAYRNAGIRLRPNDVWHKLGATPMIGQNDEPGDRITVDDASRLLALVRRHGLGRVSMWSANRDIACGAQFDAGTVSDNCSGVSQKPHEFGDLFAQLPGRAKTASESRTVGDSSAVPTDDPATSPYPIWAAFRTYKVGAKITWHHNVYEAKWFSRGDVPDAPVAHEWDTPWRFLGPVLPGDHPAPPLPPGTYPTWSAKAVYVKGDRVELDGVAYESQWWTRAERPDKASVESTDYPWIALGSS